MWIRTCTQVFTNVDKKAIWRQWTDINSWHKWHSDLEYCKIDGPFKAGNYFTLKPKGVSPVKIVLTEVDEYNKFTDCTTFFGAKMYDTHILEEVPVI